MAQAGNIAVQNNFIKGYITEATGLKFPEDACTDTTNCVFDHRGFVERRFGFDFEDQHQTLTQDISESVINGFVWKNAGGDGDVTFVVCQYGNTLRFYRVRNDSSLSSNIHAQTINLVDFAVSGTTSVAQLECHFAFGNGRLFVTNRRIEPFFVEYDVDTNTFSTTEINVQTRDLEGDPTDPYLDGERPALDLGTLGAAHLYNLYNQGWVGTTLNLWDTARTDMPSNADVSWYFKDVSDAFDFTTVDDRAIGNSLAPKGHFIYSIWDFNRSDAVPGAQDSSIETERFSTIAFHAGRVWYSGLKISSQSSRIYFSRIVTAADQYGQCYQVNDPTSEKLFDLLPSDGGFIDIIDCGTIYKLIPMFNSMVVIASNGVWSISGSQGQGFTANDYSIARLSEILNVSSTSFVYVEGAPYWWGYEGIWTLEADKQSNSLRVKSVTDQNIRSFYMNIPVESKQLARGAYDPLTKRIVWIYKSVQPSSFSDRYIFDQQLVLNMLTGSFARWAVDVSTVQINGIVDVFGATSSLTDEIVIDGTSDVVDGSDSVVDSVSADPSAFSVLKYLNSYNLNNSSFAECYSRTYTDWFTYDNVGIPYESSLTTGYVVRGKGINKFQETYINLFSTSNSKSSFKIMGVWDWAGVNTTGRWGSQQIVNYTGNGYDYKPRRIKIRGSGLALQFRIVNNGTEPFDIIGWSVYELGNQKP